MLLIILVGWIVFSYAFAEFAPIILLGLCHLIGFLFLCLWQVVKLAAAAVFWLIAAICRNCALAIRKGAHGLYLGCVFLFYVADEWRRGPSENEDPDDAPLDEDWGAAGKEQRTQEHEEPARRDPYEDALTRLGLRAGCTLADLKRAYKQAIRHAHPDAGGSPAAAQAVNAARDLIARRHGWM